MCKGHSYDELENFCPPPHSGLTCGSPLPWSSLTTNCFSQQRTSYPGTWGHLSHWVMIIWCHLQWASTGSKFLNKSQGHWGPLGRDWTNIRCHGNGFSAWPWTNCLSRWVSRRKQGWLRVSLLRVKGRLTHLLRQRRQAEDLPWMLGISVKVLSSLPGWGFLKCRDHLSVISPSPAEPLTAQTSVQGMVNLCCPINAKLYTSVSHTVLQTACRDPWVGHEITFGAAHQHFY